METLEITKVNGKAPEEGGGTFAGIYVNQYLYYFCLIYSDTSCNSKSMGCLIPDTPRSVSWNHVSRFYTLNLLFPLLYLFREIPQVKINQYATDLVI